MCLQKLKDKLFMSDSNRRSRHEAVRLEINKSPDRVANFL